jgi:mannose-1-phosphate guanylyltransferase
LHSTFIIQYSSLRSLVLTAGLGTRLRPLTYVRAKAAVPVNGEPLARRVIAWLVRQGIDDVVLNLHHQPASLTARVGDGADLGARVRYTWEQPVLGSAGGPRRALPLLLDRGDRGTSSARRTFLLVNGDTLTDVDVNALIAAHERSDAAVTMALIPNPRPDKYGGVLVADGRVRGFTPRGAAGESYHFIGVQTADARVFQDLDDGVPAESVGSVYRRLLAAEPDAIAAFVSHASFQDIGTPADYLDTSLQLARTEGNAMTSGERSRIDPTAHLDRTAVWDDVSIGAGAQLTRCVVADGVKIPAGAVYTGCAIVPADGRSAGPGERLDGELLIADM